MPSLELAPGATRLAGFGLYGAVSVPLQLVRMVFRSFLSHTSGAHLNRSALWCYRYGGQCCPLSPRRWAYATMAKNIGACLVVSVFDVNLRQRFTAEKRTRAPLTISWLKVLCARRCSPLTSPLKLRIWNRVKRERAAPTHRPQKQIAWLTTDVTTAPKKVPSYVNQNRSHLNRTIFEDELIKGRKSIVPLIHAAEKLYTEKTGQKCQKSFAPFREACLHLKEGITDRQLLNFKTKVEQETKWKVIGIWLHEDEGHAKSKYIEGEEGFEINHHAHVLFSCQNLTTGKAIRADRKKAVKDAGYSCRSHRNGARKQGVRDR